MVDKAKEHIELGGNLGEIGKELSDLKKNILNQKKPENTIEKKQEQPINKQEKIKEKEQAENIEETKNDLEKLQQQIQIPGGKRANQQGKNSQTIIPEIASLNRPEAAAGIQKAYSNIENTIKTSTEDPNPIARFFGKIIKRINP